MAVRSKAKKAGKRSKGGTAAKSTAARKSSSTALAREARQLLRGPVVTIELTPEQQEAVRRQTKGKLVARVLKLRAKLDLKRFLTRVSGRKVTGVRLSIAPPPQGQGWC